MQRLHETGAEKQSQIIVKGTATTLEENMETGRLCVKIAGRDAGKKCVIVDKIDKNFVLIDGQTRRKKCNRMHLEPLGTVLKIRKGASHDSVVTAFQELNIEIKEKVKKEKKTAQKPAKKEQ